MTREEFIQGLRDAADFFDARPNVPTPPYGIDITSWIFEDYRIEDTEERQVEVRARMADVARAIGTADKTPSGNYFRLTKKIGPGVTISFYADRANVCTARVVGTRIEPGRIVAAREVPIIEWDCGDPLLAS